MTEDKTRWKFAEELISTYGPSLGKHGKKVLAEMRDKDPATYHRLVVIFFGAGGQKDEHTKSMIFAEMLKCYQAYTDRCTMDALAERVLEAQAKLQDAVLEVQGRQEFAVWNKSFNVEAYLKIVEEPRQKLQEANERLYEEYARVGENVGCYDS